MGYEDFEVGFLVVIIVLIAWCLSVSPQRETTIQKLGDKACIEQFGSESKLQSIESSGEIKCTKKEKYDSTDIWITEDKNN